MSKPRICSTCGHGATDRLLAVLRGEEVPPKKKTKLPPKRLSKKDKTTKWARMLLQRYK